MQERRDAEGKFLKNIPRPGVPVRGSRSGAPIMALFDLLGRRWSMGVLWTICEAGPVRFRELQERCESLSPTVLNARLKELNAAKFIVTTPAGYEATPMGRRVYEQLVPLGITARDWAKELEQDVD